MSRTTSIPIGVFVVVFSPFVLAKTEPDWFRDSALIEGAIISRLQGHLFPRVRSGEVIFDYLLSLDTFVSHKRYRPTDRKGAGNKSGRGAPPPRGCCPSRSYRVAPLFEERKLEWNEGARRGVRLNVMTPAPTPFGILVAESPAEEALRQGRNTKNRNGTVRAITIG